MKAFVSICLALFLISCGEKNAVDHGHEKPGQHAHVAPHGGTAVELGEEEYHLELVLNATEGKMQAFILDGELEQFIRLPAEFFEIAATFSGKQETLNFKAVASAATGEKVGDTSLFEAEAGWLKTTPAFEGVLKELNVRGTTYRDVAFSFPKGNDGHEKK